MHHSLDPVPNRAGTVRLTISPSVRAVPSLLSPSRGAVVLVRAGGRHPTRFGFMLMLPVRCTAGVDALVLPRCLSPSLNVGVRQTWFVVGRSGELVRRSGSASSRWPRRRCSLLSPLARQPPVAGCVRPIRRVEASPGPEPLHVWKWWGTPAEHTDVAWIHGGWDTVRIVWCVVSTIWPSSWRAVPRSRSRGRPWFVRHRGIAGTNPDIALSCGPVEERELMRLLARYLSSAAWRSAPSEAVADGKSGTAAPRPFPGRVAGRRPPFDLLVTVRHAPLRPNLPTRRSRRACVRTLSLSSQLRGQINILEVGRVSLATWWVSDCFGRFSNTGNGDTYIRARMSQDFGYLSPSSGDCFSHLNRRSEGQEGSRFIRRNLL